MKSHNDTYISCPFNQGHKMPSKRLPWHLVKCKSRADREKAGLKSYHCRHNYLHIYLTEKELHACEAACGLKEIDVHQERIRKQKELNQGMLNEDTLNEWDPLNTVMNAYRADQQSDPRK